MSDPLFYGIVVKGESQLLSRNSGEDEQYVSTRINAMRNEIADLEKQDYDKWVASSLAFVGSMEQHESPPDWMKDIAEKYFTHYIPTEYAIVAITEVE